MRVIKGCFPRNQRHPDMSLFTTAGPWRPTRPAPADPALFIAGILRQPHKHGRQQQLRGQARPQGLRCTDPLSADGPRTDPRPGRAGCPALDPPARSGAAGLCDPPRGWVGSVSNSDGATFPEAEVEATGGCRQVGRAWRAWGVGQDGISGDGGAQVPPPQASSACL